MPKHLLFLLPLALAAPLAARAQEVPLSAATPQGFANAGFKPVPGSVATGDLNGDGRPDAALVLARVAADQPEGSRTLLVLWGQAGGSYRRGLVAPSAVLCATCGGTMGDPFEQLAITKGVLSVRHRGGSRELWTLTAKFRYQRGDFYQIGETYDVTDRLGHACPGLPGGYRSGTVHRDENLLTGQYERVEVSEGCQFSENKRGKQPVKPLVRLLDYKPQP